MHIIVIGWLFVILMMSVTAKSVVGGVLMFMFYGVAPVALLLYIFGARRRRERLDDRSAKAEQADKKTDH